MSKYIIRILLGLTALTVCLRLTAAPRVLPIQPSEYGAANKNWDAAEDDHGFTYFGNDMGLLEFDGLRWKLYKLPKASVIRSVEALSHTTVYTGGFEEFGRWDRSPSGELHYTSLVPDRPELRPRNSDFWKIHITPQGVWFQSFTELYLYDYTSVHKYDPKMNLLFLLRSGDQMWAQKMGGPLFRFDKGNFTKIPGSEPFSATTVRILLALPEPGHYLVGTGSMGIRVYDGREFREWNRKLSSLLRRDELNCGIRTSRGTYLFGTILGGIYETDSSGHILQHLSTDNLLDNNSIMSLFEDDSGNIWAMSDRGLDYLIYQDGIDYHTDPRWRFGSVYDAVEWQGRLFIGTNQGVYYLSLDSLHQPDLLSGFRQVEGIQGQVWSFSLLDGKLLCCHNSGVLEIGNDLTVKKLYNMGGYRIKRTQVHGRELTLYASYYKLRSLDLAAGTMNEIGDLPESIYNVEVDHMQNLWLEHPVKGVYRCRLNEDLRTVSGIQFHGGDSGDGLPYKLQVFRVGGRAVLMGGDRFFTYNDISDRIEPDSQLNACFAGVENLRRIIPISGDRFWAVTDAGAYRFSYDGYTASLLPCEGIPPGKLVYGYENITRIDDSTELFCCDNGFILHHEHPLGCEGSFRPDKPSIETLAAGMNRSERTYYNLETPARIPYHQNTIGLRFSARDAFARQLSFRYRLRGMDAEWSDRNTTGEAIYARLPKGQYTFEVRAEDRFGNTSDPTCMHIEILSPWYASAWAYVGYVVLSGLLLYLLWLVIMSRYRRDYLRKLRYREILSLRTANKELHQELEIREAEIFSQSSMLIAKNELIHKIREMIADFNSKQGSKTLTPLFYKINTFIHNNLDTDNDWRLFLIRFEQKHAGFFRILKERYPDLTSNDLRLCACLKLCLDTKEIASLMNLSVRAVENSRYRLRKKLGLQSSQNLNDFLMEIDPEPEKPEAENTIS